ncbi:MAG TPA: hypothetical protein VFG19_05265 [Geobacteraceae bacterium]|nr:hypothetical protein [Geobacteraceae bacterium]
MDKREETINGAGSSAGERKKKSLAVRIIGWSAMVFLVLYFALKSFLATPYAAGLASGYLGAVLRQPVTVKGISLSGLSISVREITLANPEGFAGAPLATARLLRIRPDMGSFLAGKKSFSLLRVDGLKISLGKNAAGEWNCDSLIRLLTRKKKRPAAEFFVGTLVLNDMSVKTGGLSLKKISLTLHDLSTKGMAESKLVLTGADGKGNPFRLAAEGRLGKTPDVRLSLVAPVISLAPLGNMPEGKPVFSPENGTAGLFLSAVYRNGEAAVNGHVACDRLGVIVKGRKMPLRGVLDFAARYSAARDEADLDRCSVVVNDTVRLNASGAVQHVKGERYFRFAAVSDEIRLKDILSLFPRETFGNIGLGGSLTCRDLRLAGSRDGGITSGGGVLSLRDVEATRDGRPILRGLTSDVTISRKAGGWDIGGALSASARAGSVPLEHLEARFHSSFSGVFRLLSMEIPALKAEIRGVPVRGQLVYSPGNPDPYKCVLTANSFPISVFNNFIVTKNTVFSGGTADISLRASGRGPASFAGKIQARLSGAGGTVSGKNIALREGNVTSDFNRSGSRLSATGTADVAGGMFSGNSFSGTFVFSTADGGFTLAGGKAVINNTNFKFFDISGRIPARETIPAGVRYPLKLTVRGLDLEAGETRIGNLSGSMDCFLTVGAGGRNLEGSAVLDIQAISLRGKTLGSVNGKVALASNGAVANLKGTALGGALASIARFDPLSLKKGVSFTGTLQDVQAEKLSEILPERFRLIFPAGRIGAGLEGGWSAGSGLSCGIEGAGNDITLAVKGGKTLLTGAGLTFKASAADGAITVREASIRKGEGVELNVTGSVSNVASKTRAGKFSLELEKKAVNSILDGFSAILPVPLQKANANGGGNVGMSGTLEIAGGKVLLEGSMQFDNALLDFPSHKVSIAGIDGALPFSFCLSGGSVEKPAETMSFSRENYQLLLNGLQREAKNGGKGQLLKIGRIQFGPLETDDVRIYAKSGNGMVEITSARSALYDGKVMGKGFMYYSGGFNYGTDLLINDMSLRQFCSAYPALKGYISGKLDGVVSLYGGKGGIPAMVGYTDLWARKGKGEEMLVSKEFLQKLAGRKLRGFFFRDDRSYDNGEISAFLLNGNITFEKLDLSHTNFLGMKDLSVSVAPVQNKIGLAHLFQTIREAAKRGKPAAGQPPAEAPVQPDVKWLE